MIEIAMECMFLIAFRLQLNGHMMNAEGGRQRGLNRSHQLIFFGDEG